jgi:hypothetical protein
MSDRPDLSKIKQRIQGDEPLPEPPEKTPEQIISPKSADQIKRYAADVEKMREEERLQAEELAAASSRVELEELPESLRAASGDDDRPDSVFYRGTAGDNKEVRAKIEEECSEMDFADLVITGRVNQVVPILSGKFIAEFQSLKANENFWIERNAEKHATTDWAIRSWMGYARLVMSLMAVNGESLPPHTTDRGEVDDNLFTIKFKKLMNMGEKPVEYLLVNLNWFNDRVDRLYTDDFDQLKNG